MTTDKRIFSRNADGELVYNSQNKISERYREDTPLDKAFVPYLVMILCAIVDGAVFTNLFNLVSYDNPIMIYTEISGFLFAFDVIPVYFGIQLRRLRQGLVNEKFTLVIAIIVCILAMTLNVFLRLTTIDLMSPADESTAYFGAAVEQKASEELDPSAIALTALGIIYPVLTSLGSTYISYISYNPLKNRKRLLEQMRSKKADEIRRIDAFIAEFEADADFAEHLKEDDDRKYQEMEKLHKTLALSYIAYVRQKLKEHLADPAATDALSVECSKKLLEQLDKEIAALNDEPKKDGDTVRHSESESEDRTYISSKNNTAA